MAILIIEAFFLTAIAVGAGVLVGILVKQWFGRRTVGSDRLTEVMAAAEAAEADAAGGRADSSPAPISTARSDAAVSVVKKGFPVPPEKMTTRPLSR